MKLQEDGCKSSIHNIEVATAVNMQLR